VLDGSNAGSAKSIEAICGVQMLDMSSRVEGFFGEGRFGGGSTNEKLRGAEKETEGGGR